MKILIIDNSVFFREKLKKALYSMDNAMLIREEETFEGGKSAFSSYNPDLVIIEIELQGKSGIKLIEEMKSLSLSTTIIIFTNYLSEEFRSNCLENGADYFFDKCKNYRQMLEVINSLLTVDGPHINLSKNWNDNENIQTNYSFPDYFHYSAHFCSGK